MWGQPKKSKPEEVAAAAPKAAKPLGISLLPKAAQAAVAAPAAALKER